jgi:hypothetical protein
MFPDVVWLTFRQRRFLLQRLSVQRASTRVMATVLQDNLGIKSIPGKSSIPRSILRSGSDGSVDRKKWRRWWRTWRARKPHSGANIAINRAQHMQ